MSKRPRKPEHKTPPGFCLNLAMSNRLQFWHRLRAIQIQGQELHPYLHPWRGLSVLSSVDWCEAPTRNQCWHWIVSVSHTPRRPVTDEELAFVRVEFEMEGAEEDNHERLTMKLMGRRSIARKLWLPEPPEERGICPCKDDGDQQLIEAAGSPIEIETGDQP